MSARFEIVMAEEGQFLFNYINGQGDTLMTSCEFESQDSAERAIKDVRVGSLMSNQIAKGETREGDRFFVIKNSIGEVLVKSVLFDNEMHFNNALYQVKDNACIADIAYAC